MSSVERGVSRQATDTQRPLASIARVVGLAALFCALVYAAIGIMMALTDRPFGYFSRDPAATLGGHPLVGALTYAGVLIVWGAAVACLLMSALLSRGRVGGWVPLLLAGIGTAYLAIDDLVQLHEGLLPKLGVAQELVLAVYAIPPLAYLWWYRDFFRRHEWPLLALALLALGASVAVDQFGDVVVVGDRERFVEEGFKLFGYSLLGTYFVRLALRLHDAAYKRPVGEG